MAKPTQLPEWGSDGGAVVTPEPSAGKKAAGFIVDERPPVNWMNWLFKRLWQWCAYLDALHNEPEFLNKGYAWEGTHDFQVAGRLRSRNGIELVNGLPTSEVKYTNAAGLLVGRARTKMVRRVYLDLQTPLGVQVELDLPNGADLTRVRASTNLSGTAAAPITMTVQKVTADKLAYGTSVETLGAVSPGSAGPGIELHDSGAFSETIDNTASVYRVLFPSSGDTVTGTPGSVLWLEMQFTDYGPRND